MGVLDTTNNEIKLNPNVARTDNVNINDVGYGALTSAVLQPQDTWLLNDGNGSTTAADTAPVTGNAYQSANPNAGQYAANLNNSSWASDATRGTVLSLNGTNGYASTTTNAILNTANSFSVSVWVNMPTLPTSNSTIVAEDGNQLSSFYLQYRPSQKSWCLLLPTQDVANGWGPSPCTTASAVAGSWVHLTAVYNATSKTAALNVNGGGSAGGTTTTATNVTTWAGTGALTIGAAQYNAGNRCDYFPGLISDVQVWNYALSDPQVAALYQQVTQLS
jgi:hypothetical protein